MPTVQLQQLHCATPRHKEFDNCLRRSCCENLPSLTARVSKLSLYDGKIAFSSKGFSTIFHPSRGPPATITAKDSTLQHLTSKRSSKPSVSTTQKPRNESPERKFHKSRSPTPPKSLSRNCKVPSSSSSTASILKNNQTKITKMSSDSIITNKLAETCISERNANYNNLTVQKEESSKRTNVTNANYLKFNKFSHYVNINIDNKDEVSKDKTSSRGVQLLHPGWRRVPWKPHFGWTDSHQEHCKLLLQEVKKGLVESIYYSSEEEHAKAAPNWRTLNEDTPFLSGPSVFTVTEVLEVIRKISASRPSWLYSGRARWNRRSTSQYSDYDADDEDCL